MKLTPDPVKSAIPRTDAIVTVPVIAPVPDTFDRVMFAVASSPLSTTLLY